MRGGLTFPSKMGRFHSSCGATALSLLEERPFGGGHGELCLALREDRLGLSEQLVLGGNLADGAVQAHLVVFGHVLLHEPAGVVEGDRAVGAVHSRLSDWCQRSSLPLLWG